MYVFGPNRHFGPPESILAEEFASPDLELVWLSEDDNNLGKNEQALESRLKLGALTLNELRDSLGLDPYQNPAADRPMVLTASGYVPIEANAGGHAKSSASETKADLGPPTTPVIQKYNPDQPRVPAGSPQGGQWTREDADIAAANSEAVTDSVRGSSASTEHAPSVDDGQGNANDSPVASDVRPDNTWIPGAQYAAGWPHHFVPWANFSKYELQPETRQVFVDATSGPLADTSVNRWSKEHKAYNDAVDELFKSYLQGNNIPEDQTMRLTPAQAEEFVDEVFYSSDPRIRSFNMRIWYQAFRYWQRYGGGRGGGDEE